MAEMADLPEEQKSFACKAAVAILNMCDFSCVFFPHCCLVNAGSESHLAPLSPSMQEDLQKDMLEGPITPDALFGPNFQTILEKSQKTDEVSETVRHLVRPQPDSRTPSARTQRSSLHSIRAHEEFCCSFSSLFTQCE
ncbi:hypothetical protein GOODEAATRI_019715 [Goodea atripinnis]|uniref:Uncharacterized protein n=1 Tax=Goodea atripinnis TaxID=208336 RepID=A0ABV0PFF0_9TELE